MSIILQSYFILLNKLHYFRAHETSYCIKVQRASIVNNTLHDLQHSLHLITILYHSYRHMFISFDCPDTQTVEVVFKNEPEKPDNAKLFMLKTLTILLQTRVHSLLLPLHTSVCSLYLFSQTDCISNQLSFRCCLNLQWSRLLPAAKLIQKFATTQSKHVKTLHTQIMARKNKHIEHNIAHPRNALNFSCFFLDVLLFFGFTVSSMMESAIDSRSAGSACWNCSLSWST